MVDFVTSLHGHFGRKLAKLRGSVEDAVFNEKRKWKTPKDVKWEALQDGYLGFSKFGFLTHKISKKRFFLKMIPKIQNF